jgi:hypothetical protein
MFCGVASPQAESFVSGHAFRRAENTASSEPALAAAGLWDTFSIRNLGLLIETNGIKDRKVII